MVLTSCVPTSDAMAHPESMQGLTFQQPPSCYSYPWKIITPFWELSSCFYLFIYKYLPLFRVSKHILPKITWITCFLFNISFVFLKKFSGESHDHDLPTRNTHQLWTRSGRHLPSLSIGLLPLGSFGSGQFFLHLSRAVHHVHAPPKKNG